MIQIRKSQDRGYFDHGWLKTYHTFSFADYFNRNHMGYRTLRVINDDEVESGQGFGTHGHRDMEILSYVVRGSLEHKDSMGNGSVIQAGDMQYMSAGQGVTHSEFNPSSRESMRLLQIWILPNQKDLQPRYDQKHFNREDKLAQFKLVVSPDGEQGSIFIHQDVRVYASVLETAQGLQRSLDSTRFAWVQMVSGSISLNEYRLEKGDGAAIEKEDSLQIKGVSPESEFLLFDLA